MRQKLFRADGGTQNPYCVFGASDLGMLKQMKLITSCAVRNGQYYNIGFGATFVEVRLSKRNDELINFICDKAGALALNDERNAPKWYLTSPERNNRYRILGQGNKGDATRRQTLQLFIQAMQDLGGKVGTLTGNEVSTSSKHVGSNEVFATAGSGSMTLHYVIPYSAEAAQEQSQRILQENTDAKTQQETESVIAQTKTSKMIRYAAFAIVAVALVVSIVKLNKK